jgi:hypothetical protein
MGQWDEGHDTQTMPLSSRQQNTISLVAAIEQVESAYLSGSIDHSEFAAQMRELDDKLAIVGLALAIKPKANARV